MNKMKEVAQLLGVELGEEFSVINRNGNERCIKYSFSEKGLLDDIGKVSPYTLTYLLTGENKIKKSILNNAEKQYLENVLRPFKDKVEYVSKHSCRCNNVMEEYIEIEFKYDPNTPFPSFERGKMYKGMTVGEKYTLKELGLFEDEN